MNNQNYVKFKNATSLLVILFVILSFICILRRNYIGALSMAALGNCASTIFALKYYVSPEKVSDEDCTMEFAKGMMKILSLIKTYNNVYIAQVGIALLSVLYTQLKYDYSIINFSIYNILFYVASITLFVILKIKFNKE